MPASVMSSRGLMSRFQGVHPAANVASPWSHALVITAPDRPGFIKADPCPGRPGLALWLLPGPSGA